MNEAKTYGEYKGRTALVTGGLGFIGSNLVRRLVEVGTEVSVLDAMLPDQGGNPYNVSDVRSRIEIHRGDVCDPKVVTHLVGGVDYIFNLAGRQRQPPRLDAAPAARP